MRKETLFNIEKTEIRGNAGECQRKIFEALSVVRSDVLTPLFQSPWVFTWHREVERCFPNGADDKFEDIVCPHWC